MILKTSGAKAPFNPVIGIARVKTRAYLSNLIRWNEG
jgi:hypothetical protein